MRIRYDISGNASVKLSITTILAAYGAITATASFGWTIFRDRRDRARPKLDVKVRCIATRTDGQQIAVIPSLGIAGQSEPRIFIKVVNVGRRPFCWSGWGGKYKQPVNGKGGFVVSAIALPKMLSEQEAHSEFTWIEENPFEGNIKRLFIWDNAGKEWSVPKRQLKALMADVERYRPKPLSTR